jgi:hypothetical protein
VEAGQANVRGQNLYNGVEGLTFFGGEQLHGASQAGPKT